MRRGLGVVLVGIVIGMMGAGCAPSEDEAWRGPDGGVISFDPDMIGRDAGTTADDQGTTPIDHGTTPIDHGTTPIDHGPPDLGPPTYVCRGVSSSCLSQAGSVSCASVTGCRWEDECTGVARGCYSIYSSYSCTSQSGCTWNYTSSRCSGYARSCSAFGASSCYRQDGCRRESDCTGVSASCSSLSSEYSCEGQPGCRWEVL